MMQYLIEVSHTPEECMQALDEMDAQGMDILKMFRWGCKTGDHRGWAFVMADNDMTARDMLPTSAREKAIVVPVVEFTSEQLRMMHESM
ncbi:MAG: hypothetical protein PHT88_02625 [Candidatus Moranbacteria bacterium]|nr:hypothetical protein [Candidatus Moranbacteria bacterium]